MNVVPFPRSVWQPTPLATYPVWFCCPHRECREMFGAHTAADAQEELELHLITDHDEPEHAA